MEEKKKGGGGVSQNAHVITFDSYFSFAGLN